MFSFDENQVVKGIRLCLENAERLVREAQLLYQAGHLERALALSILALEELGKLVCINGLTFSIAGRKRGEDSFNYVRRTHQAKLSALYSYPLIIFQFAGLDENRLRDGEQRVNSLIQDFNRRLERLAPWIGGVDNLERLNHLKQRGLYVDFDEDAGFIGPSGFEPALVEAVTDLADGLVKGFSSFVPPNLERYRRAILAIRETVSSEEFDEIRSLIVQEIKRLRG